MKIWGKKESEFGEKWSERERVRKNREKKKKNNMYTCALRSYFQVHFLHPICRPAFIFFCFLVSNYITADKSMIPLKILRMSVTPFLTRETEISVKLHAPKFHETKHIKESHSLIISTSVQK